MEQFCPAAFFSKNKNTRFHIPVQIPFWRGADDPENIMEKAMDAAIKGIMRALNENPGGRIWWNLNARKKPGY